VNKHEYRHKSEAIALCDKLNKKEGNKLSKRFEVKKMKPIIKYRKIEKPYYVLDKKTGRAYEEKE